MRVLHVISGMDPQQGGVCQAVRTMIAGLADQGVESEVASLDAPDAPWTRTDSFVNHTLGPAQGPWGYSAELLPWLLENLTRFDAVLVHGLWLYHGYGVRKALRRLKLKGNSLPKLFVMPHGMLDPYFQRAEGRKLKAWRNWAYWKLIESKVVNDADGLFFTCETERLLAHEPFRPYHPRRESVVGLGVEAPPAPRPAMQAAFAERCPGVQHRPYLLFLSRIHEKKGVELLLEAYAHSVKRLADQNTSSEVPNIPALVIAGPGIETLYGQRIRQLAAELTAPAVVFFPGMLNGDAKWGAFYGCEAFALPSHQENFGIAVVEALACSKPVLISNQVNIWREIEAAGAGIAAPDTLAGTEATVMNWGSLPAAEKKMFSERAKQVYQSYFAIEPATLNLIKALKRDPVNT